MPNETTPPDDGNDHSECGHTAGTDLAHCVHQERSQVLIDAAFKAHDLNATSMTEVRKVLREITEALAADSGATPVSKVFTAKRLMHLSEALTKLNLSIITSRKLVKGEVP